MKVLFLHGRNSVPGGVKPTYLKDRGHDVLNPKLPDDDFAGAVRIAQAEFDQHRPQVVVGSSRGGAVAVNIDSGEAKLVLLCPAWKKYGTAKVVKPGTVILHSRADDVVPFADSEELVKNSGLPPSALIEVGRDHRLADPEPLAAMNGAARSFSPPASFSGDFRYAYHALPLHALKLIASSGKLLSKAALRAARIGLRRSSTAESRFFCRGIKLDDEPGQVTTMKSTVDDIRRRFDADVERFSNLDTGQSATVDAPLAMALVAQAAAATTSHARHVLDVGCGAGNYTLKLLERLPNLDVTLIDLSQPMLDRATERVSRATNGRVRAIQGDIREVALPTQGFDIVLAAAVLHHLRTDTEWRAVFASLHRALRPGGSVWVFDLVESSIPAVQQLQWRRYGEYLTRLKDDAYRDHVFAYVEREDTPRPLLYQLDLLREVGFAQVDVLHKNVCFAAFGAVKG